MAQKSIDRRLLFLPAMAVFSVAVITYALWVAIFVSVAFVDDVLDELGGPSGLIEIFVTGLMAAIISTILVTSFAAFLLFVKSHSVWLLALVTVLAFGVGLFLLSPFVFIPLLVLSCVFWFVWFGQTVFVRLISKYVRK